MKIKFTILLLFLGILTVSSQEVIASQGNSYSNASASIDFTIGEVVIATLSNTGNTLTQGFHQTNLTVLAIEDFDINYQARVFPNPTQDLFQVEIQNFEGLNFKMYDIQGRQLSKEKLNSINTTINTTPYAKGLYLLVILSENNQLLKTYRIIKN
ncbi:MAG: T9SS type A sorting domain-containing protein [Aureibaculum sp.]